MKTLLVCYSRHHGNTKKLADAIVREGDVTLVTTEEASSLDWSEYDLIGLASGIYFQKFHEEILTCAKKNLPQRKKVFLLYTCGTKQNTYTKAIAQIAASKEAILLGSYGCRGFDTFGPFRLVGGIAKGHPHKEDIEGAVKFFRHITEGLFEES